jgi:hypothetical protein
MTSTLAMTRSSAGLKRKSGASNSRLTMVLRGLDSAKAVGARMPNASAKPMHK